jgi:hypothetical protein
MLARVVTRGRRIQMLNRVMWGGAVAAAATVAGVGVWLGTSGAVDLVDDDSTPATVTSTEVGSATYFACPNQVELGVLHAGDRVFITGEDADGEWVEVRSPDTEEATVWVRADVVAPDEGADLPEVDCDLPEEIAAVSPTTVPGEAVPEETTTTTVDEAPTTTVPGSTPTPQPPGPTPPTPQPPTPPPADTTGPSISDLQRTSGLIREDVFEFCDDMSLPLTSQVSAVVSDPSGVASVEVRWSFNLGGTAVSGSKPMSPSGGRYQAILEFPDIAGGSSAIANTNWSVRAVDAAGNSRVVSSGANNAVQVQGCAD